MSPRPSVRNKNRNKLLIIVQQATRRAYITANFERATSKALAGSWYGSSAILEKNC